MVFVSLYFLLGTLFGALALLMAIVWYNPVGRTEKELARSLAHFDRVCQDALQIAQDQERQMPSQPNLLYMSSFTTQCEDLRTIPDAKLILLGQDALMNREDLVERIEAWNRHAGSVATTESLLLALEAMSKSANHLKDMVSETNLKEAQEAIHNEILIQAVAPAGKEQGWTH